MGATLIQIGLGESWREITPLFAPTHLDLFPTH